MLWHQWSQQTQSNSGMGMRMRMRMRMITIASCRININHHNESRREKIRSCLSVISIINRESCKRNKRAPFPKDSWTSHSTQIVPTYLEPCELYWNYNSMMKTLYFAWRNSLVHSQNNQYKHYMYLQTDTRLIVSFGWVVRPAHPARPKHNFEGFEFSYSHRDWGMCVCSPPWIYPECMETHGLCRYFNSRSPTWPVSWSLPTSTWGTVAFPNLTDNCSLWTSNAYRD